jgi:hypothetical protein
VIETREQYERARTSVERFERMVTEFDALTKVPSVLDSKRIPQGISALRVHIKTLRREIADYEARGTDKAGR